MISKLRQLFSIQIPAQEGEEQDGVAPKRERANAGVSKAVRFLMDPERRAAEIAQAEISSEDYPSDLRKAYLSARQDLAYLPTLGKSGGVLTKLATVVGKRRQYVDQVLYASEPATMWKSKSETIRQIWFELHAWITSHPLLYDENGQPTMYKAFFQEALQGRPVGISVNSYAYSVLVKRLQEFGLTWREEKIGHCPASYVFYPTNRVMDDDMNPLPSPQPVEEEDDVLQEGEPQPELAGV